MSTPPLPAHFPTLDQVGALLRARTKDKDGDELGTFTVDTRPTDVEVYNLMYMAESTIVQCIGDGTGIPVWALPPVTQYLAMRTAMLVELAYWPEQTADGDSIYQRLYDLTTPMVESICAWMSNAGQNPSDIGLDGAAVGAPAFGYPAWDWVWYGGEVRNLECCSPWVIGNDGSPLWGVTIDDLERTLMWDHR
jgi:hypothetical protein